MTSGASLVELEFALDTRTIPRNVLLVYSTFPPLHGELGDRRISQALALIPDLCRLLNPQASPFAILTCAEKGLVSTSLKVTRRAEYYCHIAVLQ